MVEEVLPGVYRIELPLPRNPLRSINSYIIPGKDRTLVIDTGMNRVECIEVMDNAIDELGIGLENIEVLVTHMHADHLGLAPYLTKGKGRVYIGSRDLDVIEEKSYWKGMLDHAMLNGFPGADPESTLKKHPGYKYGPLGRMNPVKLHGGEILQYGDRELLIINTPGHTNGHICALDKQNNVLFSGDHVLGDITPNISLWSDDGNPLSDYISSLKKIRNMEIEKVLPGHRSIIKDHRERIDDLIDHHEDRCSEVLEILEDGPLNGMEIASRMSWDLTYKNFNEFPIMQKWFALGEALAHIRFLERSGTIGSRKESGVILYQKE